MPNWKELMKGQPFISDMGSGEHPAGQYAVWSPVRNSDSHQIIEVSNSLNDMMEKYNIPGDRVCYVVQSA